MSNHRRLMLIGFLVSSLAFADESNVPTAAEFVASTELAIEHCSALKPSEASKYASVREKLNAALVKKNYSAVLVSDAYKAARATLDEQMSRRDKRELDAACPWLAAWASKPPTELMVRE